MRSQISLKTNDKKSTNEIISRHLASNLHIGMSRDLTTAFFHRSKYYGCRLATTVWWS